MKPESSMQRLTLALSMMLSLLSGNAGAGMPAAALALVALPAVAYNANTAEAAIQATKVAELSIPNVGPYDSAVIDGAIYTFSDVDFNELMVPVGFNIYGSGARALTKDAINGTVYTVLEKRYVFGTDLSLINIINPNIGETSFTTASAAFDSHFISSYTNLFGTLYGMVATAPDGTNNVFDTTTRYGGGEGLIKKFDGITQMPKGSAYFIGALGNNIELFSVDLNSLYNNLDPQLTKIDDIVLDETYTNIYALGLKENPDGSLDLAISGSDGPTAIYKIDAAIPGDLNADGFVGLDDLDLILSNWNLNAPPADTAADPTADGYVGLDDLDIVLTNWNTGTPPTAAIPEPASLALLALSLAGLNVRRRVA